MPGYLHLNASCMSNDELSTIRYLLVGMSDQCFTILLWTNKRLLGDDTDREAKLMSSGRLQDASSVDELLHV